MGHLLSAPIDSKHVESAQDHRVTVTAVSCQGYRNSNEDKDLLLQISPNTYLFGVFDGHGGDQASAFVKRHLTWYFKECGKQVDFSSDEEIKTLFLEMDEVFLRKGPQMPDGTTVALAAVIFPESDEGHVTIIASHVGDSEILFTKSDESYINLTPPHKPSNEEEQARILSAGGSVASDRVDGSLAVSRAVGDRTYKGNNELPAELQKVIAVPTVTRHTVPVSELSDYRLVVMCDGLVEAQTDEQVCNDLWTLSHSDLTEVCCDLIDHSITAGSKDNHSVLIVKFEGNGQQGDFDKSTKSYIPGSAVAGAPESTDRKFLEAVTTDLDSVAEKAMSPEVKELRRKVQTQLAALPEQQSEGGNSPFALQVGENNQIVISANNIDQLRALLGMMPAGETDAMDDDDEMNAAD